MPLGTLISLLQICRSTTFPALTFLVHLTQLSLHILNPPTNTDTHTRSTAHTLLLLLTQFYSSPFLLCNILCFPLPGEINVMRMLNSLSASPLKNSEPVKNKQLYSVGNRRSFYNSWHKSHWCQWNFYTFFVCGGGASNCKTNLAINEAANSHCSYTLLFFNFMIKTSLFKPAFLNNNFLCKSNRDGVILPHQAQSFTLEMSFVARCLG